MEGGATAKKALAESVVIPVTMIVNGLPLMEKPPVPVATTKEPVTVPLEEMEQDPANGGDVNKVKVLSFAVTVQAPEASPGAKPVPLMVTIEPMLAELGLTVIEGAITTTVKNALAVSPVPVLVTVIVKGFSEGTKPLGTTKAPVRTPEEEILHEMNVVATPAPFLSFAVTVPPVVQRPASPGAHPLPLMVTRVPTLPVLGLRPIPGTAGVSAKSAGRDASLLGPVTVIENGPVNVVKLLGTTK